MYRDRHILNESKSKMRRKNLAGSWIDYKNAHDMVPQSLKMYKIPDQVVQFIKKTMQTWRVELTAGKKA